METKDVLPVMHSPCEDSGVWLDLLRDLTAGSFATTKADIETATSRVPEDQEVNKVAKMKIGVYLRVFEDSTNLDFRKRAGRALKLARTLLLAKKQIQTEVTNDRG